MAYAPPGASKDELRRHRRQLGNIIDLNKCMGCQTCTVACKSLWTNRPGAEHMRWMNVTTFPGAGYPRDYERMGGGYAADGTPTPGALTDRSACGDALRFNHAEVLYGAQGAQRHLAPTSAVTAEAPDWSYNWDEDEGGGRWPNPYFFYLPRKCYHCDNPPCLEACTHNAIYKREEDGIVVLDQTRCRGDRLCVEACPYKAIYYNPVRETSEKCILCYPRVEQGIAPACDRQCPGRTRLFGYLDDEGSALHKLVVVHAVALPLHPEFGTRPNVFYVPPFDTARAMTAEGALADGGRIALEVLGRLFGPRVGEVVEKLRAERAKRQRGEPSEIMDLLIGRRFADRFVGFDRAPHTGGET